MGGFDNNKNFILNCEEWTEIFGSLTYDEKNIVNSIQINPDRVGAAPVTGAVQNIGFINERDFYLPYFSNACKKGLFLCVGDGAPDEKLLFGLEAIKNLNKKACFFLKPYPQNILFKRIDNVRDFSFAIGIDIDAYNILTMRNQVKLEKKTVEQLNAFRKYSKRPLAIKGVFTKADIELCSKVKPEIIVVSNHGGRIETEIGSTVRFLKENAHELKKYCKQLWVDGGIRKKQDVQLAIYFGADKVLVARPLIKEICNK